MLNVKFNKKLKMTNNLMTWFDINLMKQQSGEKSRLIANRAAFKNSAGQSLPPPPPHPPKYSAAT